MQANYAPSASVDCQKQFLLLKQTYDNNVSKRPAILWQYILYIETWHDPIPNILDLLWLIFL